LSDKNLTHQPRLRQSTPPPQPSNPNFPISTWDLSGNFSGQRAAGKFREFSTCRPAAFFGGGGTAIGGGGAPARI